MTGRRGVTVETIRESQRMREAEDITDTQRKESTLLRRAHVQHRIFCTTRHRFSICCQYER